MNEPWSLLFGITLFSALCHYFRQNSLASKCRNRYNKSVRLLIQKIKSKSLGSNFMLLDDETIIENSVLTNVKALICIYHSINNLNYLPTGLRRLTIISSIGTEIPKLPNSLQRLSLRGVYTSKLPCLPNRLQELVLCYKYNIELPHLPSSLKKLVLGIYFNSKLCGLPNSLQSLVIQRKTFNHDLSVCNTLPNLKKIKITGHMQFENLPLLFDTKIYVCDHKTSYEITKEKYSKLNVSEWKSFFNMCLTKRTHISSTYKVIKFNIKY